MCFSGGTTFVCGAEAPASSPCRVLFEVARVERDGDPAPMLTCSYKCPFMWYLWCGVFVCSCRPAKTGNLHALMILPNSFVFVLHCLFLKCLHFCIFWSIFKLNLFVICHTLYYYLTNYFFFLTRKLWGRGLEFYRVEPRRCQIRWIMGRTAALQTYLQGLFGWFLWHQRNPLKTCCIIERESLNSCHLLCLGCLGRALCSAGL